MASAKLLQAVARADSLIAEKKLAGAIVMVARHGKVVHRSVHGQMDIEAGKPMRENTIFRIYSMSKPIVSVAAMMLQEEGKLRLDAPLGFPRWPTFRLEEGPWDPSVRSPNMSMARRALISGSPRSDDLAVITLRATHRLTVLT